MAEENGPITITSINPLDKTDTTTKINKVFNHTAATVKEVFSTTASSLSELLDTTTSSINNHVNIPTKHASQVFNNVTPTVSSGLSNIFDFRIKNATEVINNITSNMSESLGNLVEFQIKNATKVINNVTSNPSDSFNIENVSLEDNDNVTIFSNLTTNQTNDNIPFYLNFRNEPWVIPLISIALINVALILIFEVYMLCKSCAGRRHLFLGQTLLLGLFACSVLALLYVPQPHWVFCGITRAGIGIVYTLVFGTLLVKCIFLLKFHHGVYFNASFQALFLFFIVAVEIAIVTQWIVYEPPHVTSGSFNSNTTVVCQEPPLEKIIYLSYPMLLMFMVIVAAIRTRALRENHREAVYIGLSIAFSLIFWVAWISVALIFDRRYEAPAEAFGLVSTALMIFLLIFIPKAVHLASRKGNLDSGSTSHSVLHTPSFLHLQPHAVLPSSTQGTLVKQNQVHADYCRRFSSSQWRYDYPSFHQMAAPNSDVNSNSMKKSNGSSYNHSHLY